MIGIILGFCALFADTQLFYKPSCRYCRKVTDYLEQSGKTIDMKEVKTDSDRQKLIEIGGKSQVPCLVIDGKPLYESDAIIDWLKKQ